MTETWLVQVNQKLSDGSLINVRGTDANEVLTQLSELAEGADRMLEAMAKIKQVSLAKGVGSAAAAAPAAAPRTQHAPPAANGALACMHGPYKDTKGKRNAKGEVYKFRYYCKKFGPEGCRAEDLAGQEAGS